MIMKKSSNRLENSERNETDYKKKLGLIKKHPKQSKQTARGSGMI